jgi:hypothetical protein
LIFIADSLISISGGAHDGKEAMDAYLAGWKACPLLKAAQDATLVD